MTPADLKIRREALGLSQDWLAEQVGVRDRAVRRWESGEHRIPDDVEDLLDTLENRTDEIVENVLTLLEEIDETVDAIDISAYATNEQLWYVHPDFEPLPASWHRAVLARVRESVDVDVVFHFPIIE